MILALASWAGLLLRILGSIALIFLIAILASELHAHYDSNERS